MTFNNKVTKKTTKRVLKKPEVKKNISKSKSVKTSRVSKSLSSVKTKVKKAISKISSKAKVILKNKNKSLKVSKQKTVKKIEFKSEKKENLGVTLHRSLQNPIIKPRAYSWESKATMNPTAFIANGKIHILYRAIGEDDVSVLGYASSYDGYHVQDGPTYHAYRRPFTVQKIGLS